MVLREERKAMAALIRSDPYVDLDAFQILEQLSPLNDDDDEEEVIDELEDVAQLHGKLSKLDLDDADNALNTTEETVETNDDDDDDEYEYTDLIYGDPDEDEYLPIIV